jgi:hypothetical protein
VNTTVTITGSYNGKTVQSPIVLTPQQPPATLTLSPTTTTGTQGSSGVVTIASPASGDLQIPLASSNTAVATVNHFVTIPSGSTTGGFLVSTTGANTSPTTVTISATAGGVTKSAVLTVNPFGSPPPPPPPPPPSSGPLPAPTLLSPADGSRFNQGDTVPFDWTDVSGAASYVIQVSSSNTFPSTVLNQTVTPSQFATSTLPASDLFWRVRANDSAGSPGAWSTVLGFRIR